MACFKIWNLDLVLLKVSILVVFWKYDQTAFPTSLTQFLFVGSHQPLLY